MDFSLILESPYPMYSIDPGLFLTIEGEGEVGCFSLQPLFAFEPMFLLCFYSNIFMKCFVMNKQKNLRKSRPA